MKDEYKFILMQNRQTILEKKGTDLFSAMKAFMNTIRQKYQGG